MNISISGRIFHDLKKYIMIGLHSFGILFWELSAFEVITIFSGYLSVNSTAAHVIIINTNILLYMIPAGLSIPIASIVGKQFGLNNIELSKRLSKMI